MASRRIRGLAAFLILATVLSAQFAADISRADDPPAPLLAKDHPVAWWFVFKFNTASFPGCGAHAVRSCPFGGTVKNYAFSQQFVFASSESPGLKQGGGCAGTTTTEPLGATFAQVYNKNLNYVIWNDQFYDDPSIQGCGTSCSSPWGHSKGMLAWNDAGEGLVLQVTTPSWPAAGSHDHPRPHDGNTLGCVKDDNVKVSQHFFALKLTKDDVVKVLKALKNASVVTDPTNHQIVNNGGPADVQALVQQLGVKSNAKTVTKETLSTGIELISKPSALHVPPWQLVSAELNGIPLRAATWWASPQIPTTKASSKITCWDPSLPKPGRVQVATSGRWNGTVIGLKGGPGPDFNHAKIGVSLSTVQQVAIFGDLNQQGTLSAKNCASSQNGRGGLFYVVHDTVLADGITKLIKGKTALPWD